LGEGPSALEEVGSDCMQFALIANLAIKILHPLSGAYEGFLEGGFH